MATTQTELAIIDIRGVVQGVGFRPFVYQLASRHKLNGWVRNTSEGVSIEIEGARAILDRFVIELREQAPPMARIESLTAAFQEPSGYQKFEIRDSISEQGKYQLISPDIATCHECLADIIDRQNRRFHYPFTNCTNCGPRFTIIEDIPYDRPKTTMRHFVMCPECKQEYEDPSNRRFHAQPNACPTCGPQLKLLDATGHELPCDNAIEKSCSLLNDQAIIAIKGLGGFLLACDATNTRVVEKLRQRKQRPCKPFAVMVATVEEAEKHCLLSDAERSMLLSPQSPIVL
ncbi:MAG TPA: carbamoyltransferase HypF, partial [Dehalococcoidia bacterium]|nr:carbamoyltransferase HypF [Dehalococcoidia bacterium]